MYPLSFKLHESIFVMCNMVLKNPPKTKKTKTKKTKTRINSLYCFVFSLILALLPYFTYFTLFHPYFTSVTIWSTLLQYRRDIWPLVHVTNMLIPVFEISTIIFTFNFFLSFLIMRMYIDIVWRCFIGQQLASTCRSVILKHIKRLTSDRFWQS